MAGHTKGLSIIVKGVVQGVGFRPFVYRLAKKLNLSGNIRNTGKGVLINVWGEENQLEDFIKGLKEEAPPLARLEKIITSPINGTPPAKFEVLESEAGPKQAKIPADVATCEACLAELFDPQDRRYRYPFINCTDCGPRFSVILDLPYDRVKTTMHVFPMCPECLAEYQNPENRRFHAEPNACPVCGPQIWLVDKDGNKIHAEDPVTYAIEAIKQGKIVALRGLGGFLLACDATNEKTVKLLRYRKKRPRKPFAIMVKDLESAESLAFLSDNEKEILTSPKRPIVLAKRKLASPLPEEIAPGLEFIGLMLPYTPLHHLILKEGNFLALVMTSGNLSGEPLCVTNDEALRRLSHIADLFLFHNREIVQGIDDSVVRVIAGKPRLIRRARGYVPEPLPFTCETKKFFAFGAHLKNTFTLTRGKEAFISQHIGDLEDLETLNFFQKALMHFENLLDIKPEVLVCDLHPGYLSTQLAEERAKKAQIPLIKVQHHVAHAAAVAGEFGLEPPFLALILDGLGLGDDGTLWGGELLKIERGQYEHLGHLFPVKQPGGDAASREAWRMLLAYLYEIYGEKTSEIAKKLLPKTYHEKIPLVLKMLEGNINAPITTSTGRLFDACAALLGICFEQTFEGEAPMLLESLALKTKKSPIFSSSLFRSKKLVLDTRALIKDLLENLDSFSKEELALSFHLSLAHGLKEMLVSASRKTKLKNIVFSGGVFQNKILAEALINFLRKEGLKVYFPEKLPVNDGAISYGQAVWASWIYERGLAKQS